MNGECFIISPSIRGSQPGLTFPSRVDKDVSLAYPRFFGASDANYHLWMRSLGILRIRSFSIAVWPASQFFQFVSLVGWRILRISPDFFPINHVKSSNFRSFQILRYFKWFLSASKNFPSASWVRSACLCLGKVMRLPSDVGWRDPMNHSYHSYTVIASIKREPKVGSGLENFCIF